MTTKRHVARKSHRHERNDAYARYYDPGRNSYYGGYGGYGGSRNGDWLRLIAQSISHAHFLRVELLRSLEWGLVDKRRVLLLGRMAITQQHQYAGGLTRR